MKLKKEGLERNYANAFFEVALDKGLVEKATGEVLALAKAWRISNGDAITRQKSTQLQSMQQILNSLPVEEITRNFLLLLAKNSKLYLLESIAQILKQLQNSHDGICEVRACSALPLGEKSRCMLLNTLEEILEKKVSLVEEVDASLLGGIVIAFDGKVLDLSVRAKLKFLVDHAITN